MIHQIQSDKLEINSTNVANWLLAFQSTIQTQRLALGAYYDGENKIIKQGCVEGRPNYSINVNLAKYITDVATGYVFGKPVTYTTSEEHAQDALSVIDYINKNNDIAEIDFHVGGDMSTYGVGYQMVMIKEGEEPLEDRITVKRLNPETTFIVTDNTILKTPICAIYYFNYLENGVCRTKVYAYDKEILRIYDGAITASGLAEVYADYHNMGSIPIIESLNNDDAFGDFKQVTDILDAINLSVSNNTDNMQSIANAILAVSGAKLNEDQIQDINRFKVANMPQGSSMAWITKTVNSEAEKTHLDTLLDFVFQISQVPDLTDEAFGGTQSGVAMQYKLWGINQLWATKVRKYTNAIYKRLAIFLHLLQFRKSTQVQLKNDINITFYKNLPSDHSEEYEMVKALKGTVSEKTLLENISIVADVENEIKQIDEENAKEADNYGFNNNGVVNELLAKESESEQT